MDIIAEALSLRGPVTWVYQNLSVPLMLIGQTIAIIQSHFLNRGFLLSLVISIVCFLPLLPALAYSLDEFLRIEHESGPLFSAAKAMIVVGGMVIFADSLFYLVSRGVVRAFLTLPLNTVILIRDSVFLIGVFSIGIGALMVRGRGSPALSEEFEQNEKMRRWTVGGLAAIIGLITGAAGLYRGLFFSPPRFIPFSSGAIVFLLSLVVMKKRPPQ